jgi:phage terminase small subunit
MTPKQEAFVREYLIDLNATQAAIRAGYSAKTACEQGSRLLADVKIAEAIAAAMSARAERTEITSDMVLEELAMLAFYDPADIATVTGEDGSPVRIKGPEDIAKLPRHIRKAIVGWNWDKAGNFTLRFAPKPATLQLIGQHLGMFKQEIDVNIRESLAQDLEHARRRAAESPATRH